MNIHNIIITRLIQTLITLVCNYYDNDYCEVSMYVMLPLTIHVLTLMPLCNEHLDRISRKYCDLLGGDKNL